MGEPTQNLRLQIDCPDGWRDGYLNREQIADPGAFVRGLQVLAVHTIADNYVCELTRIEAGVFAIINPKPPAAPTISQLDQLHWWAPFSDQHPPGVLPPPPIDWFLHLVQLAAEPDESNQPPPNGQIIAVPVNALLELPIGDLEHVWPILRFGLVTWAAHKIVIGPTRVALVASWRQPPPAPNPFALPWQFAQSWGLMEGRDLRYDSPEARRLLLGGLT